MKLSKKKPKPYSKLEVSLIFNLAQYEPDSEGWKYLRQIVNTNEKIQRSLNEEVGGWERIINDERAIEFGKTPFNLKFTSQEGNIPKYIEKLKTRGLLEERTLKYQKDKSPGRKEWRLKRDPKVATELFFLAKTLDMDRIQMARLKFYTDILTTTPYFNGLSESTRQEIEETQLEIYSILSKERRRRAILAFYHFKFEFENAAQTLKDLGIKPKELDKNEELKYSIQYLDYMKKCKDEYEKNIQGGKQK